ncbi:discoidin domain-containing protein [Clostridium sp. D5]|uniref:discoidin domain-containing protein n=1 Tax=Clostridium sp. D5 TaxID=556261 RepID=UPI0002F96DB0|nr:discoidin domain-containing protein [Clostridium sp. D5]
MKKKKALTKTAAAAMACCMLGSTVFSGAGIGTVRAEAEGDSEWNEIQSIVSRYYGEWNDTNYSGAISDHIPDTALLGNGDVGVTSAGNGDEKSFYISKGDFWTYEGTPLTIGKVRIGASQKVIEEETGNLAPSFKEVTVSSRDINPDFKPEDAVSGKAEQNSNGYGWVSSIPAWNDQDRNDYWMKLEFENPITIGRWAAKWDGYVRPGQEQNNPKSFTLQISDTGNEWQDVDTVEENTASVSDRNLEEAVTAKFVRLHIPYPEQNDGDYARARVGQFELYTEPKEAAEEPSDNLAFHKPVKVCSSFTDQGVLYPGENIVDGKDSTKWCSLHDNESTHWAIIDLEAVETISYYDLVHSGIIGETDHNTVDYQLQYLDSAEEDWETIETLDDSLWKDMDTVTGNTATVTSKVLENPVSARYIRLYITKPASGNKAARIHELDLRAKAPAAFYEKQDILNAEIQTTQELAEVPTEMKTWLSSDKNIMVTELKSNGAQDATFQVETSASDKNKVNTPITAENTDSSVTVTRSTQNKAPDNPQSHVSKAALSTKIIGADDVTAASDNEAGKGNLEFTLKAGQTVYIVTSVGGGGRTYHNDMTLWDGVAEPVEDAQELLAGVADESAVSALNDARQTWWKDFWSASYVDLGTEDENLSKVQKYYYGAQYLLGSSTKEGEVAPGIYALWHTTDSGWWNSDYHLNYNFMSAFYGTNTSNRTELSLPGIKALLEFVPEGQKRAGSIDELKRIKSDFVEAKIAKGDIDPEKGIENALLYPVGIGPWGMTLDNNYHNEALNASYNSYLFTQYYDYTMDDEFLANDMYEYLKQCVAFYESWLEKEGDEYVLYAGYNEGSWAKNPAVELASLKHCLKNLIQASEALGRDEDRRAGWKEIYNGLSAQPTTVVNGKTVLALGEKQWDGSNWIDLPSPIPGDGNALPLDSIIPGGVYNYFSSPEDLQMVQDTIDVFSQRGGWSQANNFPRLFPDAVKARYDTNTIVTKLVDVINRQMQPNLKIKDGMHGIEKSGSTETINSMMLISEEGITKIFPNWYADKSAKFAHLRAKGAFTVSAEYDGSAQEAKNVIVTSEKGKTMTLVSPWAEGATVRDSAGNIVKTADGTVPNWEDEKTITFDTVAGEAYTVEKGEAPVELDYEAIDKVISEAQAIKQDGYTQESYQTLQDALKNAMDARQNATTQDELNQKKDGLRAAIDGLKGSKNVLETFLNRAKQHVANGDVEGLVESVQKLFTEAIAEGEAVMNNENAKKEDVLKASLKLMKAIQALDMKAGDKADLGMALELTDMIDLTKYVEAGQKEYLEAKTEAEHVMENGDAMQPEVDTAWETLVETMMNLRLKADKSTLSDLLDSVKNLDLDKYTDETAAVYKEALAAAMAVMEDDTLSQDDQTKVDEAVMNLMIAKADLKEKEGGGNNNGGNNNGGDNNGGNNNGGNNNGGNNNGGNSNGGSGSQKGNSTIKTGDTVPLFIPVLGILMSMGAAVIIGVAAYKTKRR